jgi:hypothetical protein
MAENCALPAGRLRSPLSIVLVGVLLSGLVTVEARAAAQTGRSHASNKGAYRFKRAERCFMRRINRVRARYGLRRLRWDKHIGYVARRHARRLRIAYHRAQRREPVA